MDLRRQRIALVIHAAAQAQRAVDYVLRRRSGKVVYDHREAS
jgi:hypothetical protein